MTHTSFIVAGRYRLDGRIAAGGAGEVWRASDLVLARPVAVKLLRPEYAQHPQTLARFRAEARHASSVSHPGIAQVYDYGEDGAQSPYLVMELVDGPSLAGVLAAGPLDPAFAMDVLAQAAAGLQAAHAAGLVHRDIKPANLLVGPAGQVKITDFGIAYAAGSAPITRAGTIIGTPAYLAPERAAGGPATPASDLYSLGVVGYECLTGAPPFSGLPVEVAAAHRNRAVPALPPAVPLGVAGLITELTAKDPADRPATAGEVASRAGVLRDALGRGGNAEPPVNPGGSDGFTRMDADPPTLTGLSAVDLAPADRRPGRHGARPRRGAVLAVAAAIVVAGLAGWLLRGGFGTASPQRSPGPPHTAVSTPAARMVAVNADALTGQPVHEVSQQLSQLGLQPHVVYAPANGQDPGTVVSVQPSGQVPAGSVVTVTAALGDHGHGHGNGQGGNGGD